MCPKLQSACRTKEGAGRKRPAPVPERAVGVGVRVYKLMSSPSGETSSKGLILTGYFFCFFRPDGKCSFVASAGIKSRGEHCIS